MIWRLGLILLILTVVRTVLARLFNPSGRGLSSRKASPPQKSPTSKRMVKDPQCGMYLAPELAVEARTSSGSLFFCSKECREQYLQSLKAPK